MTHPLASGAIPDYTPSFTTESRLLHPSTGTLPVSTQGSIVWGTVMAREIMHADLVLRSRFRPASHCSSHVTVSLGRIRISLKLHPVDRLRRTLPSISTSRSVKSNFAARATSWNVVVKHPAREHSSSCSGVHRPCNPPSSAASEK